MIHLALVIAAVLFIGWVALQALGLIVAAFDANLGCGCLATVVVVTAGIIVLFIAL